MATTDLSKYDPEKVPSCENMRFGLVVSEWNSQITSALAAGAVSVLRKQGAAEENIVVKYVPGSFELPLLAQYLAVEADVDAVICLGCVIQGETRHFDYVCSGVTQGIMQVSLEYNIPVAFGVLTTDTLQQALDRAGGKHGNKGVEAAIAAIKMVDLNRK